MKNAFKRYTQSDLILIENLRLPIAKRTSALLVYLKLHGEQAASGRKAKSARGDLPVEEGGGEANENSKGLERVEAPPLGFQNGDREQDEESNRQPAEASCPNEGR